MEKLELIKDYKINEKLDIEKIYDDFYGYVYTITVNIAKNYLRDEDIEEVISDTFLVLWKNKGKLENSKKIKPYIAGITKNLIKEKARKNKIHLDISDYENKLESTIDLIEEEREEISELKTMINKLKKQDRNILELYYYQSMKIKEIANYLKVSEFTVKQRLYRIRKQIKKEMEKKGGYRNEE